MTRLELLQLVVARARANGFEFRRWYTGRLSLPWISSEAALTLLDGQRRYYALVFAHDFARAFWKAGTDITFEVPENSFERTMPDGTRRVIHRKPFIRRSSRRDVWRYHLREMALAEEPLRYLRKYLHIEEDLDPEEKIGAAKAAKKAVGKKVAGGRPLPAELPAFLQRPYRPGGR